MVTTRSRLIAACLLLAAFNLPAQTPLLDINTATPAQLIALPGMGPAYANRIIAGRPYTAKNQLVTRGVLPQAAYERIKERIIAHRAKAIPAAPTSTLTAFYMGACKRLYRALSADCGK